MSAAVGQAIGFYGYWLTSPLGFLGHICSLITFSSKTLRQTSTGVLFICLTISDILYLSISIRDFITFTAKWPTIQNVYLCRVRTFIVSFSTVTSAWLLVLIALDRWVRAHFPHRQARLCTPKVAACFVAVMSVCSTLFACHVLQPEFTFTAPGSALCGPPRSPSTSYSVFYYDTWPILQLPVTYLIPSFVMIICSLNVYSKVRTQRTLLAASIRKERMQRQMLILMISSVVCFAVCTIPYAIYRIVYLRSAANTISPIVTNTVSTLMNSNYCYNFYIHCLTSHLFRETCLQQLKRVASAWYRRQRRNGTNTVHPLSTLTKPGTLP